MKSFVLAFALLLTAAAQAQESSETSAALSLEESDESLSLHLIPTLGASMVGMKTDEGQTNGQANVVAGALVDFGAGTFTFESGLFYNQFGGSGSLNGMTANIQASYLALPLFAKFNFSGDVTRSIFIRLGLMPSVLMSQSGSLSQGGVTEDGNKKLLSSSDLPLVIGLGGAIPVTNNMSIMVNLDYTQSLISVLNVAGTDTWHNQGFIATTGLMLAL